MFEVTQFASMMNVHLLNWRYNVCGLCLQGFPHVKTHGPFQDLLKIFLKKKIKISFGISWITTSNLKFSNQYPTLVISVINSDINYLFFRLFKKNQIRTKKGHVPDPKRILIFQDCQDPAFRHQSLSTLTTTLLPIITCMFPFQYSSSHTCRV